MGINLKHKKTNKMEPKTVKSYLKLLLEISYTDRDILKGVFKLTNEEYSQLGDVRAAVQNELGEMGDLLAKHGLKYNSNG